LVFASNYNRSSAVAKVDRYTPYDQLPEWLTVEEFQAFWKASRNATYDGVRRGSRVGHQPGAVGQE
jgi:hypothetical protein